MSQPIEPIYFADDRIPDLERFIETTRRQIDNLAVDLYIHLQSEPSDRKLQKIIFGSEFTESIFRRMSHVLDNI